MLVDPNEIVRALNQLNQGWLAKYNTYRPHLSLNIMTPQEKLRSFSG